MEQLIPSSLPALKWPPMTIPKKAQKNTVGAWLLHHDQKLTHSKTTAFESIAVAGRSARLLSVITREGDWSVSIERVNELANGIGIRKLELPGLLGELERQGLIAQGVAGISVLGVSQVRLLDHAADIFESQNPGGLERASIDLAERGSHRSRLAHLSKANTDPLKL
jgi:hypothetical protein